MNRCKRCDNERSVLNSRGLCPSCEYFVTTNYPAPAPVAPTSADVLTVPSGHNPAWQPDLDEEWQAILARLPEIRASKHNLLMAVSGDNWDRVDDLFAIVRGQEDIIAGLRAANAALQAKVDTHHYRDDYVDALHKELTPAPHGGATADRVTVASHRGTTPRAGTIVQDATGEMTATHLCAVEGCGKVATHVSDLVYRDGVQAHYCDEHSLHERPIGAPEPPAASESEAGKE